MANCDVAIWQLVQVCSIVLRLALVILCFVLKCKSIRMVKCKTFVLRM